MKTFVRLALLLLLSWAGYRFFLRPDCVPAAGRACPDPALEAGVGTTLDAREVCREAGYLCAGGRSFQVARWPLDTTRKLKLSVPLPEFLDKATGERVRQSAIEGLLEWDGHPLPLEIDTSNSSLPTWDVRLLWTEALWTGHAGLARPDWRVEGKRIDYAIDAITVVVPPEVRVERMKPRDLGKALLARIRAVATHELGHALGLGHSDAPTDIMFPTLSPELALSGISERDLRSVDALYALPNGATVE